jgi:hypothetical protein
MRSLRSRNTINGFLECFPLSCAVNIFMQLGAAAKTTMSTNRSIAAFLNGIPTDLFHLIVKELHVKLECSYAAHCTISGSKTPNFSDTAPCTTCEMEVLSELTAALQVQSPSHQPHASRGNALEPSFQLLLDYCSMICSLVRSLHDLGLDQPRLRRQRELNPSIVSPHYHKDLSRLRGWPLSLTRGSSLSSHNLPVWY